ncbi:MAG TPA: metallophosphoesterase family protein [Planctomycetota bacterium]|nr:metallophosphoesterase family protein [Planctomycetota bacterium]
MTNPKLPALRARARWGILLMTALASGCFLHTGKAPELSFGPYLDNAGRTGITVRWASELDGPGLVRWGPVQGKFSGEARAESSEMRYPLDPAARRQKTDGLPPGQTGAARLYQARIDGLAPGTEYRYSVEFAKRRFEGRFRTFPARPEPFAFVAFSDTHLSDSVAARFADHRPAFLINSGDLVDREHFPEYARFFSPAVNAALGRFPMFTARGNHDESGRTLSRLFTFPEGRLYYSFDYANAHFVCLDSCLWRWPKPEETVKAMLEWLEADLQASRADWKIVFFHEPPYDMSYRRSDTDFGRLKAMPVLRRCGVDLVFSGHAHSYQRFGPLFRPGENDAHPIVTIVTAGAGTKYVALPPRADPQLAVRRSESNYVVCRIDGPTLTLRALTPAGAELDSLTIARKDGRPDPAHAARAVPDEPFGSVARALADLQISRPAVAAGEEFTVELELASIAEAYDFEIAPAPDSFWIAGLTTPAQGTVPAGGRVPVTVRLRAKTAIARPEKGNRTEPEFSLECRFQAGANRGVVTSDVIRVPKPPEPAAPAAPATPAAP